MRRCLSLIVCTVVAAATGIASAGPPPAVTIAPPFEHVFSGQTCYSSPAYSEIACDPSTDGDVASSGWYDGSGHQHARMRTGAGEGYANTTYIAFHDISRSVEKIEYVFTVHVSGRADDGLVHDAEVRAEPGWADSAGVSQLGTPTTLVSSGESVDGVQIFKSTFQPRDELGRPTGIAPGRIIVSLNIVAYANASSLEESFAEADIAILDVAYKARQ